MALGAYNPSPNSIDSIIWAIDSLKTEIYKAASIGPRDPNYIHKQVQKVVPAWFRKHGQALMDQWQQDFNSKVPYRGLMPRIWFEVTDKESKYGAETWSIPHKVEFIEKIDTDYLRFYNDEIFHDPIMSVSLCQASASIGLVLHEFVHTTQDYSSSNPYLRIERDNTYMTLPVALKDLYSQRGPTYEESFIEQPTYAVTHSMNYCTSLTRKIYRDHNIADIIFAHYNLEASIKHASVGNKLGKTELNSWAAHDMSLFDSIIVSKSKDLGPAKNYLGINKKAIELYEKTFDREGYIRSFHPDIVNIALNNPEAPPFFARSLTAKSKFHSSEEEDRVLRAFMENLKPLIKLRRDQLGSWIRKLDPVNVHFAQEIQGNLKSLDVFGV